MRLATFVIFFVGTLAGQESRGLALAGRLEFPDQATGDIWVHRQIAYLGGFTCGSPVKVVDVANPAAPTLVATLDEENVTSEDVAVIPVRTAFFAGDLAAVGLQVCREGGFNGVQLWDVTDPRNPRRLGRLTTGAGTRGVHELSLLQRDERVLALLAVPGSTGAGAGGDFRIVDVTNPDEPVQLADWRLSQMGTTEQPAMRETPRVAAHPEGEGHHHPDDPETSFNRGAFPSSICHSTAANASGTIAFLSHWDAGVVFLDMSDPGRPGYLGRTTYQDGDEGNAHSVALTRDGRHLLVADEDFHPLQALLEIMDTAENVPAVEGSLTAPTCGREPVTAEIVYVGTACNIDALLLSSFGRVALADAGGCTPRDKVSRAQAAGALAIIVANTTPGPPVPLNGNNEQIRIPGVAVSMADGERLKQATRVTLREDPRRTWGYLRIYDIADPANPRQVATFATERTRQCPPPDSRWYTIHNPFVVGDAAYLSWYAEGVRVLDISDPTAPRETGYYVPENSNIWGVFAADGLVYLSDIGQGLLILRPTGE